MMALMLIGALPVLGVALWIAISATQDTGTLPPLWLLLAQVALGASIHFFIEAAGYRTRALAVGTDQAEAETTSRLAFQSTLVRRFAFCEVVAILSIAAAFTLSEGGFLGYVTGALVSLALMTLHVWPTPVTVERIQASLERDGATSYLKEALGLA
jgi:hypothetical protein